MINDDMRRLVAGVMREHFEGATGKDDGMFGYLVKHCIVGCGHEHDFTNEEIACCLADLIELATDCSEPDRKALGAVE